MSPLRGRDFCLKHDPLHQLPAVDPASAQPVAVCSALDPTEIKAPTTRAEVRVLLQRTIEGVLTGRLDPRRGKVVQDLARQLLPLMPADTEPDHADLPDGELLVELERQAEIVRARIERARGGNGKSQALTEVA